MTARPKTSRRGFFAVTGGLAGAAGLAASQLGPARADQVTDANLARAEPFYGARQAGITTPMQGHIYFAAFDLGAHNRAELISMLQAWTAAGARLTAGLPAEGEAARAEMPPPDSGEAAGLGAARLTLTFGFGPDMFSLDSEDRYGIAAQRPAALIDLPRFPGDQLVEGQSGGAICIQACADDPQIAFHAVRQLARLSYGAASLKWTQTGFSTAPQSQGTPRNLLGFKDGTMNPAGAEMDKVVWAGQEGPAWMENGSYMVLRRIRLGLEHWDRMKLAFQEQVIGRQKASGAPLGGHKEFDAPDFDKTDADGNYVIPETSHLRLAAAVNNNGAQILRRSYSYNNGANFTAERWPPWHQGIEYDSGLFFQAYQSDPRTGFVPLFTKMSRLDALNQFSTHVASAVFACPPGVRQGGYIGETLFATTS